MTARGSSLAKKWVSRCLDLPDRTSITARSKRAVCDAKAASIFCATPLQLTHRKRRRIASGAAVVRSCEPDDDGVLPPCDHPQTRRGALAFGSHQHKLRRAVIARAGI